MVHDDLVATVRAQRGLYRRGNGAAGIDIAEDGAIFGVVAIGTQSGYELREGPGWQHLLLVALLEEARIWRVGYRERHEGQ
jgi:hypothetical protein